MVISTRSSCKIPDSTECKTRTTDMGSCFHHICDQNGVLVLGLFWFTILKQSLVFLDSC